MSRKLLKSSALRERLVATLPCIAVIAAITFCSGASSAAEESVRENATLPCGRPPSSSWIVMIKGSEPHCFGSLVSDEWILTSSLCTQRLLGKASYILFNGGTVSEVNHVFRHDATATERNSSLGFIQFKEPVHLYAPNIWPICLPKYEDYNRTSAYTIVKNTTAVFKMKVSIVGNVVHGFADKIPDNCQYVEGSPVMVLVNNLYYLVGVTDSGDCKRAEFTWLDPHKTSLMRIMDLV